MALVIVSFLFGLFAAGCGAVNPQCVNTADGLRTLRDHSETVVYGTITGSRLVIIKVIKSNQGSTSKYAELDVTYDGAHALPNGSKGVFFGQMSATSSTFTVYCALEVANCLLQSLEKNEWDICGKTTDHCRTKNGEVPTGTKFEDYVSGEECTCLSGVIMCEKKGSICQCKVDGVARKAGETWKADTCNECTCTDKAGVCSYKCEEDVCLSFILPIITSVVIISLIVAYVVRRLANGDMASIVDLDNNLPGADYTPLESH